MMCRFFDELQREGERIGEARGKAEGERIGRLEAAALSVKNMMAELGVTLEKACQLAEITPESYREYVRSAGI